MESKHTYSPYHTPKIQLMLFYPQIDQNKSTSIKFYFIYLLITSRGIISTRIPSSEVKNFLFKAFFSSLFIYIDRKILVLNTSHPTHSTARRINFRQKKLLFFSIPKAFSKDWIEKCVRKCLKKQVNIDEVNNSIYISKKVSMM